jgi:hypothetical protein
MRVCCIISASPVSGAASCSFAEDSKNVVIISKCSNRPYKRSIRRLARKKALCGSSSSAEMVSSWTVYNRVLAN